MQIVELVALLAVLQFFVFGALTGRARAQFRIKAPAVTGHETFERIYRVQMNTLELLVALLPALFIAARYWSAEAVAGLGAVYLLGRVIYWRAYVTQPSRRGLGFMLSIVPIALLAALAFAGIAWSLLGRS